MGEIVPRLTELLSKFETEFGEPAEEFAGPSGSATMEQAKKQTTTYQTLQSPEFNKLKQQYEKQMYVDYPDLYPYYLQYKEASLENIRAFHYGEGEEMWRSMPLWTFKEWIANTPSAQAYLEKEEKTKQTETRQREEAVRPPRFVPWRARI